MKCGLILLFALALPDVADARPSKSCRQYQSAESKDDECRSRLAISIAEPWNDKMTSQDMKTASDNSCGHLTPILTTARSNFVSKNSRKIRALMPKFDPKLATPSDWGWLLSYYFDICKS